MLLSIGERDFRVPIGNTLENWTTLQRMQVPSRLLVWPDAWHWILKPEDSRYFYREVHAWLAKYLKEAALPGSAAAPRKGAPARRGLEPGGARPCTHAGTIVAQGVMGAWADPGTGGGWWGCSRRWASRAWAGRTT